MIYTEIVPGDKVKITVGPKGFGSENMSQIRMFKPSAGLQGIKDFILEVVETAGPNPCPPMVVGVGIGGTFDKCALLAKKALMRPLDSQNPDPFYADLEKEMLEKVNKLGIGPQGFGGKTTAIGLNIETMPTHIAGMPCAVNILSLIHISKRRCSISSVHSMWQEDVQTAVNAAEYVLREFRFTCSIVNLSKILILSTENIRQERIQHPRDLLQTLHLKMLSRVLWQKGDNVCIR